jgi:hypothetical protein
MDVIAIGFSEKPHGNGRASKSRQPRTTTYFILDCTRQVVTARLAPPELLISRAESYHRRASLRPTYFFRQSRELTRADIHHLST